MVLQILLEAAYLDLTLKNTGYYKTNNNNNNCDIWV